MAIFFQISRKKPKTYLFSSENAIDSYQQAYENFHQPEDLQKLSNLINLKHERRHTKHVKIDPTSYDPDHTASATSTNFSTATLTHNNPRQSLKMFKQNNIKTFDAFLKNIENEGIIAGVDVSQSESRPGSRMTER